MLGLVSSAPSNGPRLSCGADPRRAASIETTTKAAGAQTQFLPQSGTGSFKRWLTRAPSLPDRGTLRHKGRLKVSQPFTNGRTVKRRKGLELLQGKATSVKYRDAIEELRSIVNESGLKACPELGWKLRRRRALRRQVGSHRGDHHVHGTAGV